jgi:hypothetical protein
MKKAIEQETLAALVETGAAREFRVLRDGEAWRLELRLGASGCQSARDGSQCVTGAH